MANYGNPRVTPSEEDIHRKVRDLEKLLLSDSEPDEAATRRKKEEAARTKKEAAKKRDAARKRGERLRDKEKQKSLYQGLANLRNTVNNQNEELVNLRSTVNNQNEELVNLRSTVNKLKEDQAIQSYLTDAVGMELVEQNLPNDAAFGATQNETMDDVVSELKQKIKDLEKEIEEKDNLIALFYP